MCVSQIREKILRPKLPFYSKSYWQMATLWPFSIVGIHFLLFLGYKRQNVQFFLSILGNVFKISGVLLGKICSQWESFMWHTHTNHMHVSTPTSPPPGHLCLFSLVEEKSRERNLWIEKRLNWFLVLAMNFKGKRQILMVQHIRDTNFRCWEEPGLSTEHIPEWVVYIQVNTGAQHTWEIRPHLAGFVLSL